MLHFLGSTLIASDLERIGYLKWERGYGGNGSEEFRSAAQHPDGGYVYAGTSTSSISGDKTSPSNDVETIDHQRGDYWWVHVDANGEILNDRSFGGAQRDTLSFMLALENGDFLLVGSSLSPPSGNKTSPRYGSGAFSDAWIIRVDKSGAKIWERSIGGVGLESFSGGLELSNGQLLLAGTTSSAAGSGTRTTPLLAGQDGWLVCLSTDGDLLWERVYGGEGVDLLEDISYDQNATDQLLLVGYSSSQAFVTGDESTRYHQKNYWVLAVDEMGEINWQHFYGGVQEDFATSVLSKSGTTLVAGYSDSGIGGSKSTPYYGDGGWTYNGLEYFTEGSRHHGWVIRLNELGEKIGEYIYGGIRQDEIEAILAWSEGWLIGANSNSYPLSDPSKGNKSSPQYSSGSINNLKDYWLIAANANGGIDWELSLGGYGSEDLHDLVNMPEGVFAVGSSNSSAEGGNRSSERKGSKDAWIAVVGERTAEEGAVQIWVNSTFQDNLACTVASSAELELISSDSSLNLHYTIDGSEPTTTSPIYTSPLIFQTDTLVKARAFNSLAIPVGSTMTVPVTVLSRYPLVVDSSLGGAVTVSPESPDSSYTVGAQVNLEAVASTAWQFDSWTGDASGVDPTITVEMDAPRAVYAHFYSLAITLEINGSGAVTKSPDKSFYALGESVTLEAVPTEGYTFSNWGDGVADRTRTITIGKDNNYEVTFIDNLSDEYEPYYYASQDWLYGSSGNSENLYSMSALGDGYLVASLTDTWQASGDKTMYGGGLWMLRLDADGQLVDQFMSGMFNRNGGRFSPTQDGGLLFPGDGIAQFAKYDAAGNESWIRAYEADAAAPSRAVIETSDGGYAILARTNAGIGGDKTVPRPTTEGSSNSYDAWLIKTDSAGNIVWQQSYGGNSADDPHFIIETTSGDFLLLVTTNSAAGTGNNTSGAGVWVLKVNGQNGNILWQRSYGVRADLPQGMVLNADGGFTFAGSSTAPTDGKDVGSEWGRINSFVWVLRADATGQVIWSKAFGGSSSDKAGALLGLDNGGFAIASQSNSSPSTTAPYSKTARQFGSNDYWLFTIDSDGEITWQDSFGGSSQDNPVCLWQDDNGTIIIGGNSNSPVSGTKTASPHSTGFDFWFQNVSVQSQKKGQPIILMNGNTWNGSQLSGDQEIRLEFVLPSSSAPVYYTLDGSDPLTDGTLATGEIIILENSVLRAVAIPENGDPPVERDPVSVVINKFYTLDIDVPGGGSVTVDPQKALYAGGEVVTLSATPEEGWQFIGWAGNLFSEMPEVELTIKEDTFLRADFGTAVRLKTTGGKGIIEIDPILDVYPYGEQVTLTANGVGGNVFNHWDGNISGSTNPLSLQVIEVNAVDQNPLYVANFSEELPQFNLSLSVVGDGNINSNPTTNTPYLNDRLTLTPIPNTGSIFSHWEVNDTVTRQEILSLSITEDTEINAVFKDENLEWQWVYPNPISDRDIADVVYGNGRFVAVGQDGMCRMSFNGYDWTLSVGVSPEITILSVTWDGSRFLALGYKGLTNEYFAIVSENGEIWELLPINIATTGSIQSIIYGNGQYLATTTLGYNNYGLAISPDLENWTVVKTSSSPFGAIAFEQERFVAATSNFYSSEDGLTWQLHPSGQSSAITRIRWLDGRYYATATNTVLTSLDAQNWEKQTPNLAGNFTDIVKSGGIYLLSANTVSTKPLFAGPSLSSLEELVDFDLNSVNAIEANNNTFIVVSANGWIRLSHDGFEFIEAIQPQIEYGTFPLLQTIAIGPDGTVVAGGYKDNAFGNDQSYVVVTTEDGNYYDALVSGTGINGIVYGRGQYLALTNYNKTISSTDGINWSDLVTPGVDGDHLDFADNRFFVLGIEKLSHSVDGSTWWSGNFYNYGTLIDLLNFKGGLYLATKTKLYINSTAEEYHLTDRWSEVAEIDYGNIIGLATDENLLIAISNLGYIGRSVDGINWDWVDLSINDGNFDKRYLTGVAFDGRRFLATGYFDPDRYGAPTSSIVYSSLDGLNWEEHIVAGEYSRAIAASDGIVARGLVNGLVIRGSSGLNDSRLIPSSVNYTRGIAVPGETIYFEATVLNIGNTDWNSSDAFSADFILSSERTIQSDGGTLLGTIEAVNGLQAGAQIPLVGNFTIPAGIRPDDYYLHLRFNHSEDGGQNLIIPDWVSNSADIKIRVNRFEDWIQKQAHDAAGRPVIETGTLDQTNGVANLLIYAEGLSTSDTQSVTSGSIEIVERDGQNYFQLSYTRRRDAVDLEWIPQVSEDLNTWEDAEMSLEESVIQESVTSIKLLDTERVGAYGTRFLRLKVKKKAQD